MSTSFTVSTSQSFTVSHARNMACKVATDLKRLQRFYGVPSDQRIDEFEEEVVALLCAGYLGKVTYGYKRNGSWIPPTLRYSARELAGLTAANDDPGRVDPGCDIDGARFYSFLTYSDSWNALSSKEREAFKNSLPLQRTGAEEPSVLGYFDRDRTYSAGGRALERMSVRSY